MKKKAGKKPKTSKKGESALFGGIKKIDLKDTLKVYGCLRDPCSLTGLTATCTTITGYTC